MPDRYIAIPAPEPMGDTEEVWVVRDTEDNQTLLGYYTERAARNTARRLNANINMSANQQRAFATLLSVGKLTAHQLYEQFLGKPLGSDGSDRGLRIAEGWRGHGLVTIRGEEVEATEWAYTWAGRKRP